MPDITPFIVVTRQPNGAGDLGTCEQGWFTLERGIVTLVTEDGAELRDDNGRRIERKLADGENPLTIAKRMRLRVWRAARDDDNGFNRPTSSLRYPKNGVA
jgi:hypothetical protein